jgi:hypothetical protein
MTTPDRTSYAHAELSMPDHRQNVVQLLRDANAFLTNLQGAMRDLRTILSRSSDLEATTLSKVAPEVIPLVATITTTAIAAGAALGKLHEPIDSQESLFNFGERVAFAFNPTFQRPLADRLRAFTALESYVTDMRTQVVSRLQDVR